MPINIRNTTSWRSIREFPAALFELWLRLRVRWRHNPGFVAAAAAGSMGLLLALVMAIQGGMRLLDEVPPGDELAEDDAYAALGEAAAQGADGDVSDPFAESSNRVRPANDLEFDEEEEVERSVLRQRPSPDAFVAVKPTTRKHVMDDDFDDTVTEEVDAAKRKHLLAEEDETAEDDSRGPHPLDEHPLAGEPSPPRRFPGKSGAIEDVVDDAEQDSLELKADREPDERASQPNNAKAARLKLDIAPVFGVEKQDEAEEIVVETETDSIQPAANVAESAQGGWKNQPHGPPAAAKSSPALTRRSRSVETVIVVTPEQKAAAPAEGSRWQDAGRARLSLEIIGPRAAPIGQTCKFEIRVTNQGSAPAARLTLSVELPDELVHPVGQSLEQHIEKLGPGQTYRALVRAQAKASGKAVLNADLADDGTIATRSSASVVIDAARRTSAKADLPDCECLPVIQAR